MHLPRVAALLMLSIVLTALAACSTAGPDKDSAGLDGPSSSKRQGELPAGLALPAPSELPLHAGPGQAPPTPDPAARGVSEFSLLPFAYYGMLPNSNVSKSGLNLLLEPQYSPGGPLGSAAYCVYRFFYQEGEFDLSDISLRLRDMDLIQRGSASDFHVLYANYNTNRWDTFTFSSLPGQAGPSDSTDYTPPATADYFYLAIVVTGSDTWELSRIRAGNDPPIFTFLAAPQSGQVPLEVNFTVDPPDVGTEDYDKVQWDFEGDGTFELETGIAVLNQSFTYEQSGSFTAAARVVDVEGLTHTETIAISASDNIIRTWGTDADERGLGIATDSSDNVYVCGKDSSSGLLLKFNKDLELQWSKSWKPADLSGYAVYRGLVCIGSDIYVTGLVNLRNGPPHDLDILLHKYDSSGMLMIQKTFGHATEDDEGWAIDTDGSSLYLGGYTWDTDEDTPHAVIAKLGLDGSVTWGVHDSLFSAPLNVQAVTDICYWAGSSQLAALLGPESEFSFSPACVALLDSSDGSPNGFYYYTDSGDPSNNITGESLATNADSGSSLFVVANADTGFDDGILNFTVASVGGTAGNVRFIDSFAAATSGAALLTPGNASTNLLIGGTEGSNGYIIYQNGDPPDLPLDYLDGPGSFFTEVFAIAPGPSAGTYLTCGYADNTTGAFWKRDTDSFLTPPVLTATAASGSFALIPWTSNSADTSIMPTDIVGTIDTGGGFQDIMVSRINPGF